MTVLVLVEWSFEDLERMVHHQIPTMTIAETIYMAKRSNWAERYDL